MRTVPETVAYLRHVIATEQIDLCLVETAEIAAVLDRLEELEEADA
jgi:hypothetical protein